MTMFYPVWLLVWGFVASFVIFQVLPGKISAPGMPPFFLFLWLTAWIAGGVLVLLSFLWITFGMEEVRVTSEELVLERRVFGLRWVRSFNRADISRLRVSPNPPPPWWQQNNGEQFINPFENKGNLAFDYGAKTYRFGRGIDEAEAFTIQDRLNTAFDR